MHFAVLQFPASNCDQDAVHALRRMGQTAGYVWHKDRSLGDADAVIVPGGFSYGDYLRCGAIARFSPVMQAVREFAAGGGLVLGICNGFQILCESGLLPGALVRNRGLRFRCEHVHLRVAAADTSFTRAVPKGRILRLPIAHGDGCYFADEETLAGLRANGQILFQYCTAGGELTDAANPNGSLLQIAGICNSGGNVAGMMPHPERATESILGSEDGRLVFASMLRSLEERAGPRAGGNSGTATAAA
jgi:phosphoribosylformylglycinamidine synthase subunit PurQ / glutaminase